MGMFDAIASTVNTGLSIGGALYTNRQNIKQAEAANALQAYLAANAHQIEVDDLRKAGLNPILSATGGSGAEVPSAVTPNLKNPLEAASQWAGMKAMLQNADSQEKVANAQEVNSEAQASNAEANQMNAETARWQLYDAKTEGVAGFKVMGLGPDAQVRMVNSIRVNKVTGETYDLFTGKPVRVVETVPVSSGHDAPGGEVEVRLNDWNRDDSKSVNDQLKRERKVTNPRNGLHFPGVY